MRTLTEARVKAISEPGRYRAAPTLFLFWKTSGAKSWVQRVVVNGKRSSENFLAISGPGSGEQVTD